MTAPGVILLRGVSSSYLSLLVLLPLAALASNSFSGGWPTFWTAVSNPLAVATLETTLVLSAIVTAINAVAGTLIAWVLVRDSFWGKEVVNSLIDLPFALPTIVAGLTLLALYGPSSPLHVDVAYTRVGVSLALLFVTLPFVTRAVQPVLLAADRDMEEAAAVLGAGPITVFRRIVLPNLLPAVLSGAGLAFARALGEFGSVVLIGVNVQVASLTIFNYTQQDEMSSAAALSLVLLLLALIVLTVFTVLRRWATPHVE